MKCLLLSLDAFTVFPVLLNLEVNSLKRSLPELLFKKAELLKCLYCPCSLCLKMYSFWVPYELFTCVSCYCRVALNRSCFSQICWRAAVFVLPFVYCRTVVWREVGKIHLGLPQALSFAFTVRQHSWAFPEPSRSCFISAVPWYCLFSLLFLSRTASLLLFLAISWGFVVAIWIWSYLLPGYRVVILNWEMLL